MDQTGFPRSPMEAATHPDPYAYYASLAAKGGLYRDDELNLWIATQWHSMQSVLASALCHTRPLAEPVPASIAGKPAGSIFRHLVRMIDGPGHCPLKSAIAATLDMLDMKAPERLHRIIDERLTALHHELAPEASGEALTRFIYSMPVQTLARLLGVADAQLEPVTRWVDRLAFAFTPLAAPHDIEAGNDAAGELLDLFRRLAEEDKEGLLGHLVSHARSIGLTDSGLIVANGVGFLTQAYEGTAALIGSTLIALARHEEARIAVHARPDLTAAAIQEVLRHDPPAQNTRRFIAADGVVAGQPMRRGDVILVLLGAAGRDPAVNPDPDQFGILRKDRRSLNFGFGAHACPGDGIATAIVERTLRHLISRVDYTRLTSTLSYRRSLSVRAPVF